MSNEAGNNNGDHHEPLRKRQKRGDGSDGNDEEMYDEATARKMLEEAPVYGIEQYGVEDPVMGFSTDDAALDNLYYVKDQGETTPTKASGLKWTNPMIWSAYHGDAKMCRYLATRGASTTKEATSSFLTAASAGQLEVCKFLHANGASHDIWRKPVNSLPAMTPFHTAVACGNDEVVRWLVLQGALCANGSSEEILGDHVYPKGYYSVTSQQKSMRVRRMSGQLDRLVEWANEVTQSHSALVVFLLGTLPPVPGKDRSCTLQCFGGHPGVRKHIGDFVGLEVMSKSQREAASHLAKCKGCASVPHRSL